MSYWSIYVSMADEKALKKRIQQIAEKKRWSFSQAVSGILREHLIEEQKRKPEKEDWQMMAAQAFFEGYSDKDSVYDSL